MSDNESVLSSLPSSSSASPELASSDAETELLNEASQQETAEPDSDNDSDHSDKSSDVKLNSRHSETASESRLTSLTPGKSRKRTNGGEEISTRRDTLAVPASKRQRSFDEGSDLSALTSEQDEEDSDSQVEHEVHHLSGDRIGFQDGQSHPSLGHGSDKLASHHDPDRQSASLAEVSQPMRLSLSSSSRESATDSGNASAASRKSHAKRGKGRPPTKRNALAAAAKRQASRSLIKAVALFTGPTAGEQSAGSVDVINETEDASSSILDEDERGDEGDFDDLPGHAASARQPAPDNNQSPGRTKPSINLSQMTRTDAGKQGGRVDSDADDQASDDEETSEAEQRRAPPPPAIDNSSDEDYLESSQSRSSLKKRVNSGGDEVAQTDGRRSRNGATGVKKAPTAKGRSPASHSRFDDGATARDAIHIDASEDAIDPERLPAVLARAQHTVPDSHLDTSDDESVSAPYTAGASRRIGTSRTDARTPNRADASIAGTDFEAHSAASDDGNPPVVPGNIERATLPSLVIPTLSVDNPLLDNDTGDDEDVQTPVLASPTAPKGRGRSPGSARGRGRGGRGGRGKRTFGHHRIVDHEELDGSAASAAEDTQRDLDGENGPGGRETPAASDHEEDDIDALAAKKRADALDALAKLEIEFARLRDRLFYEKMDDLARERWQIDAGTHPELLHLSHLIEHRRTRRLELARRALMESEASNTRRFGADYKSVWYDWADDRRKLRRSMLEEANVKKRRLDREKRAIERPRPEDLPTILRTHGPSVLLYYEKKDAGHYERQYSLEFEVAESLAKRRKRGATGVDHDEAMFDLERMGLRDPYRASLAAFPDYHSVTPGALGVEDLSRASPSNAAASPHLRTALPSAQSDIYAGHRRSQAPGGNNGHVPGQRPSLDTYLAASSSSANLDQAPYRDRLEARLQGSIRAVH